MAALQNHLGLKKIFLSGATGGVAAGPWGGYEEDRHERLPFKDQATLWPFPNIDCRAHSELSPVPQPFLGSSAQPGQGHLGKEKVCQ